MASLSTSALRDELERLRAGEAGQPGVWERLAHRPEEPLPETPELLALDRDLTRAGVHTLADARLLGRLAKGDKRAAALAGGLQRRARKALAELQEHLSALARRQRLAHAPSQTALDRAEALMVRLERALAVAAAILAPDRRAEREFVPFAAPPSPPREPPQRAEVATVERYLARARTEGSDLRKKRRDLDRAHALLLSLSAEMKQLDRQRAQGLRAELADERHRLSNLETLARPAEPLPRAVVRALSDGRAEDAYRGLLVMHRSALAAGDAPLATQSRAALEELASGMAESMAEARLRDPARSLKERAGPGALRRMLPPEQAAPDALLETAFALSNPQRALFDLALTAGELFDASAEDEVEEDAPASAPGARRTRVPFPTATMDFATARGIEELRDFVISDPRLVLYDLANGTQLVRAHYEDLSAAPRKTRRSAVRVYVCDASGSMRGPRARFRDAVLIAELNNLSLRAQQKREVWPIYYAFFTDSTPELTRVDTPSRAQQLIAELFEQSPARGRTDITWALVTAFEAIHQARGHDPDLARATVVLVTDGEDQVDRARIDAARAPVGDLEVTLNFISLGQENPDLRSLVMSQKRRGRRAFYTHLTDEDLAAPSAPPDAALRTLLPEHPELALTADSPAVKSALDALAALAEGTATPQGPPAATRFAAYYPAELDAKADSPAARADLDRVRDLLGAVAEALTLAPAGERMAEAVELLEHLLSLYGLDLARYRAALALHDRELLRTLARLRLLCGQIAAEAAPEDTDGL